MKFFGFLCVAAFVVLAAFAVAKSMDEPAPLPERCVVDNTCELQP